MIPDYVWGSDMKSDEDEERQKILFAMEEKRTHLLEQAVRQATIQTSLMAGMLVAVVSMGVALIKIARVLSA